MKLSENCRAVVSTCDTVALTKNKVQSSSVGPWRGQEAERYNVHLASTPQLNFVPSVSQSASTLTCSKLRLNTKPFRV